MATASSIVMPLPSMGNDYRVLLNALIDVVSFSNLDGHDQCITTAKQILLSVFRALLRDINSAHQKKLSDCPIPQYALDMAANEDINLHDEIAFLYLRSFGQAEAERNFLSSALTSTLFCATQIANYVLYASQYPLGPSVEEGQSSSGLHGSGAILPFCGGALSAYAIHQFGTASAEQMLGWVEIATTACRMAFWMGLQSDHVAVRLLRQSDGVQSDDRRQEMQSWCLAVTGWTTDDVERFFSQSPIGNIGDLYISAIVTSTTLSISGPPPALSALEAALQHKSHFQGLPATVKCTRVPVYSPFHSQRYMAEAAEEFLQACEEEGLFEDGGKAARIPACDVYSSIDGQYMRALPLTPNDLAAMICLRRADYEAIVKQFSSNIHQETGNGSALKRSFIVLNIGPGGRLGQNLAKRISPGVQPDQIRMVDLEEETIARAQQCRVKQSQSASSPEEVAIVGLAYRIPGSAQSDDELATLFRTAPGTLLRKVPSERFVVDDYLESARPGDRNTMDPRCAYGTFLDDVDKFDAALFNISPREAEQMDPQHRLYLMTAYEALERAGYAPDQTKSFMREAIGTFYAGCQDDYRDNASANIGSYLITGNGRAFASGRLSFVKQFKGPSAVIDSGESSMFSAIEVASESILSGKIETAVVGAACVITSPTLWIALDKAGLLGRYGPQRGQVPFDADANGWTRAEACVTLILKRASQAEAEGDNILATIPAVASKFAQPSWLDAFGNANPLNAPAGGLLSNETVRTAQVKTRAEVIRQVLGRAGHTPADVDFLECNASGIAKDEDIELEAITSIFSKANRSEERPLPIGSIKAVFGCAEAASGGLALLKSLLMIKSSILFPQTVPQSVSPALRNTSAPVQVCSGSRSNTDPVNLILLNSYSIGGGNACILLKRYEIPPTIKKKRQHPCQTFVVGLFGKCVQSIDAQAQAWDRHLKSSKDGTRPHILQSISHVSMTRRDSRLPFRSLAIVSSTEELFSFLERPPTPVSVQKKIPKVAFIFSGQGSQYEGMARQLVHSSPAFRAVLEECEELCTAKFGFPGFLSGLLGSDEKTTLDAATQQYAIFSIEYALAMLLRRFGITPAVVAGHSLGEYAALATAGVLSMQDALYLVAFRSQAMANTIEPGSSGMLAVAADVSTCIKLMDDAKAIDECEVACENGPKSTVLSGPTERLKSLATSIKSTGVKCILLKVPYAFHSASIEAILGPLRGAAQTVTFHPPSIPTLSNVTGKVVDSEGIVGPDYLCQHARQRVRFGQSIAALCDDNRFKDVKVAVELGPQAIVLPMVKEGCSTGQFSHFLPTLSKSVDDLTSLQNVFCELHKSGIDIDWFKVDDDLSPAALTRRCNLPTYSFNLNPFWLSYRDRGLITPGTKVYVDSGQGKDSGDEQVESNGEKVRSGKKAYTLLHCIATQRSPKHATCTFKVTNGAVLDAICHGHRVSGVALAPLALSAELYYEAAHMALAQTWQSPDKKDYQIELSKLHVNGPLVWGEQDGANDRVEILVRCTVDFSREKPMITCMLQSMVSDANNGTGNKSTTVLHSTCLATLLPTMRELEHDWEPVGHVIRDEVSLLRGPYPDEGGISVLDTSMTYDLFAKVVCYNRAYHAAEMSHIRRESGVSLVSLDGIHGRNSQDKHIHGHFYFHPLTLDAVGQISGLVANTHWLVDDFQHVYIIEACAQISLSKRLDEAAKEGKHVSAFAIVRQSAESTGAEQLTADSYVLEETEAGLKIIGAILGQKYKRFRIQALSSVLKRTLQTRGRPT